MKVLLNKRMILSVFLICLALSAQIYAVSIKSMGPYGGCFTCIEVSGSNPQIVFAGTRYGGLYRSTNSGNSWEYLGFKGDMIITSIAVDAHDPDIFYFSWNENYISGVTKTVDGGQTWEDLGLSARTVGTSNLISNVVFVGNNDGLFKSKDGGENFTEIDYEFGLNNIAVIEADPLDTSIIYLGTDNAIYRSGNSGTNWVKLRDVYHFSTYSGMVNDIAISKVDHDIVVVATSHDGVLISQDSGQNWISKSFGLQVHGAFCDNVNPNVIYSANLGGFYKSTNLGQSFEEVLDGRFLDAKIGAGKFYLVEDYTGTIMTSADKGQSWKNSVEGISNIQVFSMSMVGDDLLATANAGLDMQLFRSSDAGWTILMDDHAGDQLEYNVENSSLYMMGGWDYFSKSYEPFDTWERYESGIPYCYPSDLAMCGDTLYMTTTTAFEGLNGGIFRSVDNGVNWEASSRGLPVVLRQYLGSITIKPIDMDCICIDPQNTNILYAGTYKNLYRSLNYGNNWDKIASIDSVIIFDVCVDPEQNNIIYMIGGYSYHNVLNSLYKSADGGQTFVKICSGLDEVYCQFYDTLSNALYLGGKNGLVRSFNKGSSWENIGNDWDQMKITHIVRDPDPDILYVGTDESGIYEIDLSSSSTGDVPALPDAFTLYQNYPNPFNPNTTICYEVREASHARLDVYDMSGRLIETLADKYHLAGAYTVSWDASKYSSGLYIYRLGCGEKHMSRKMLLIK